MGILEGILAIFGSNVGGSLIGWIGGWLGKKEDRKFAELQLKDKHDERAYELAHAKLQLEIMDKELAGTERIAVIQQEGVETEGHYRAIAESFKHDSGLKGAPWIESLRAATRPVLTFWFAVVASLQAAFILYIGFMTYKVQLSPGETFELVKYSLMWVFFQSGVCIGWWFAQRNTKPPEPPK